MSSAKLNVTAARDLLNEFKFRDLFNELGWAAPKSRRSEHFTVGEMALSRTPIGVLSGIVVYEVETDTGGIPDRDTQAQASKETSKTTLEHVLVFVDKQRTQSVWHWTKREGSKRQAREHYYFKGQPGDLFLSKIASLVVDLSELDDKGNYPLVAAADKVKKAFNVERVIKRFFKDYDEQRISFTRLISGIPDEADRRWYASVLLNRLMFIYFLQRKLFLDGGDGLYLEHKLAENPGTYYKGFLNVLFFEAFAKPTEKRSAETLRVTGNIRYLNGGLFLPHSLELKYRIDVPDQAFESLYDLFSQYSWNLNDIPGESDDDINPDVLGYIFEKYINQKEFGAYYTRPEITEYLCEQTIYRLILDRINEPATDGLPEGRLFDSVPEMLVKLDKHIARKLLHDVLPDLSILDPAVGSGAFLVAALKTLLTVYSAVVGWLQFHDHAWLDQWLTKRQANIARVQYAIKKAIITDNLYGIDVMEEATEIAKLRLFMTLVASAHNVEELEPLPNIDFNILPGNSLIGLTRVEDAEFEAKQSLKDKTASLFAPTKTYRQILNTRNLRVDQYRHASGYTEDLGFLRDEVDKIENEARPVLSALLRQKFDDLGVAYERATWDEKGHKLGKPLKRSVTDEQVEDLHPFHWGFEFDSILNQKGGFDAIITNPPWETLKPIAREFLSGHSELVNRRVATNKEFEALLTEKLRDPRVRALYLAYLDKFPHQSAYFRSAAEYVNQSSIVGGKRTGTDVNLYKLFTERCFRLLRRGGLCGIVIPSGIYSDLGTTGLRKMLFAEAEITGLFCFENKNEVFEGVHRSFKFVVLSYRKGGPTESFPAAFMRHDVQDLARFPESVGMNITLETVKSLSPETLSVVEFQSPLDAVIADKMLAFPALGDEIPGAWQLKLANEFHMTNDAVLFEESRGVGKRPLYEGKMIWHYNAKYALPRFWVDERVARRELLGNQSDKGQELDCNYYRFAHRSITGNKNNRTMVCSVIPKNVFYGNSLNASRRLGYRLSDSELLLITALLSSFVVDFSLRQRVSTQLNMFFVYQLRVPRLKLGDPWFSEIVRSSARLICTTEEFADLWNSVDSEVSLDPASPKAEPGSCSWTPKCGATDSAARLQLRAEIDARVADIYGLTEEEFAHILSTFHIVDADTKSATLGEFRKLMAQQTATLGDPLLAETKAMIAEGESNRVEFKQSFEAIVFHASEWHAKGLNDNQIKDKRAQITKDVIHSSLKTICAFLNTVGGTLLIGVHDLGDTVGIAPDLQMVNGHSTDGFELKLRSMIKDRFEPVPLGLVTVRFIPIDGKVICRVDVARDRSPHHLDGQVFVREGNNTLLLTGPDLTRWVTRRAAP